MAKSCSDCSQMNFIERAIVLSRSLVIAIPITLAMVIDAPAQEKECETVKDCAQQMVRIGNQLRADNAALTKRVEELEKALDKLRNDIAPAIEARVATLKGGSDFIPQPVGNARSNTCPAGSYMVSILHQLDSGGPHGITSWLGVVCRPLN